MNKKEKLLIITVSLGAITFAIGRFLKMTRFFCFSDFLIMFSLLICAVTIIKSLQYLTLNIIKHSRGTKIYIIYTIVIIITASIIIFLIIIDLIPNHENLPKRALCASNMRALGMSILTYSNENENMYPEPNKWCDLMLMFADALPKYFICIGSNDVTGESSYAFNKYLERKREAEVSPDTVMLFETDYGTEPNGRNATVSSRRSYKVLKERGEDIGFFGKNPEKQKVYKDRWNQSGGPEILTAVHHNDKGANILFADIHVEFIAKEDFNNLNWGLKASEPNYQQDNSN